MRVQRLLVRSSWLMDSLAYRSLAHRLGYRLVTRIIWGYDPKGVARCYALHIPDDELDQFIAKAESEGWTGLVSSLPSRNDETDEQREGKASEG